jgi:hypothetical protein
MSNLTSILKTKHNISIKFNSKVTTGFLSIVHFLNEFDVIHLYGFDWGKSSHYWGNFGIADVPNTNHEWEKEKKVVSDLILQKKIKIIN